MMSSPSTRPLSRQIGLVALAVACFSCGCARPPFSPTPVVPTATRLPQTANIQLTEIGAYAVEPGATMLADPNLQNRVTGQLTALTADPERWEKAVAEYVSARRTFQRVVREGEADLDLHLRVTIYVDPSVEYKFETVYVARADGKLREQGSARLLGDYRGFGKAPGSVPSTESRAPDNLINRAIHAALNDFFGKLESDSGLASLRGPERPR